MHRFITLSFAIVLTALADDEIDFDTCLKIMHTQKHCCKSSSMNKTSIINDDIKECKVMPYVPGSCDKSLCFGTKTGIATADGILNMDKLRKYLEEKLSDHEEILENMKTECLDGRHKFYGEPDECDLSKMGNCLGWQFLFRCADVSKEESCKEFEDTAMKCLEVDF